MHQQSAWSRTSCYAVHRIISSKCALQNTVASFFDSFELQIKNKAEKLILEERLLDGNSVVESMDLGGRLPWFEF